MTQLELLIDFHVNAERQGPGSEKETLMALEILDIPNEAFVKIADLGCGSGAQTMVLARHLHSHITSVDLFPEFLSKLDIKANELNLKDKILTMNRSMEDLPFEDEEFDLIWSEGAIYHMGFQRGISEWKKYLKTEGYLAVSEVTWTTHSRPEEIEEYWTNEYPEIDTASNKIKILEKHGYAPVGYFVLSQNSWVENYYEPMVKRFIPFLEKHQYSEVANQIVEEHKREIAIYKKYKDYYNYGFYLAKKLSGK